MADQGDVRRIALALPETTEAEDRFAFSVLNKGRQQGFAWAWNERIEPKKPRVPRDDVIAVRVVDAADKAALLASDEDVFLTEPHYDGFPGAGPPASGQAGRTRGTDRRRMALPGAARSGQGVGWRERAVEPLRHLRRGDRIDRGHEAAPEQHRPARGVVRGSTAPP